MVQNRATQSSVSNVAERVKMSLSSALRGQIDAGVFSVSTLAQRIGTSRNSVRRLLDPKNTSVTLRSIVRAAEAANLEVSFRVKPISLAKLRPIAKRLATTNDSIEEKRLKTQFSDGYYGKNAKVGVASFAE